MNLRDLKLRMRALFAPRRVERDLDEELAFHIDRETAKLVAAGMSPAAARTRALARFGSPALAADRCRDARGTAFADDLVRDIRYAFTTFRRAPLAALTIVATVALGLGLVAVVFTFYNAFFLRADAVRNPGELFEVRRAPEPGATRVWVPMTRADYEAMRRDTNVFSDAFAMLPSIATRIDGRVITGTLVSGNFFQTLGVGAALGRPLMPDDDERSAGRPVIVLSHRGWSRLFAGDPAAVGRQVRVNGAPYEIIGVMPPEFRGLAVAPPDFWAPLDLVGRFRHGLEGREDEVAIDVVGRLKPGLSAATAAAGLTLWAAGNPDMLAMSGRPKTIYLRPSQGTASPDLLDGLRLFAPLFFAFGLILLIGCANVANLLLARGVARQREIGVRLSLGASRRRIIRQLLTESLLLALAAAVGAFGVSRVVLEAGAYVLVTTMPGLMAELVSLAALAPAADWRILLFLVCGAIVSTVFFGLAPALQATRLELIRTMRGELTRDARPSHARSALVAVQVGASALLLVCAAVFLRGAFAAASATPGLRTSDTVLLEVANEPARAALLQAVKADPAIAAVAASWPGGVGGSHAGARSAFTTAPVEYKFVSPEYFALLDIEVLSGRGFMPAERSAGAGVAIVSETAARRLWPDRNAVGQVVELDPFQPKGARRPDGLIATPQLPFRAFTIVGIVRDVRVGRGMFELIDADVFVPIGVESAGTSWFVRVHGDPDQARQGLADRLAKVDPAIGAITTLRTLAGRAAYLLQTAFWTTAVLASLALLLTVSGLVSVLSYIVAQRTNEIGVRMALGATSGDIARLVLSQSVRPVALGILAGGVLAGSLATVLMATPIASRVVGLIQVFDPAAYAVSLICIVMACLIAASVPALRAARIDPMTTLKQE